MVRLRQSERIRSREQSTDPEVNGNEGPVEGEITGESQSLRTRRSTRLATRGSKKDDSVVASCPEAQTVRGRRSRRNSPVSSASETAAIEETELKPRRHSRRLSSSKIQSTEIFANEEEEPEVSGENDAVGYTVGQRTRSRSGKAAPFKTSANCEKLLNIDVTIQEETAEDVGMEAQTGECQLTNGDVPGSVGMIDVAVMEKLMETVDVVSMVTDDLPMNATVIKKSEKEVYDVEVLKKKESGRSSVDVLPVGEIGVDATETSTAAGSTKELLKGTDLEDAAARRTARKMERTTFTEKTASIFDQEDEVVAEENNEIEETAFVSEASTEFTTYDEVPAEEGITEMNKAVPGAEEALTGFSDVNKVTAFRGGEKLEEKADLETSVDFRADERIAMGEDSGKTDTGACHCDIRSGSSERSDLLVVEEGSEKLGEAASAVKIVPNVLRNFNEVLAEKGSGKVVEEEVTVGEVEGDSVVVTCQNKEDELVVARDMGGEVNNTEKWAEDNIENIAEEIASYGVENSLMKADKKSERAELKVEENQLFVKNDRVSDEILAKNTLEEVNIAILINKAEEAKSVEKEIPSASNGSFEEECLINNTTMEFEGKGMRTEETPEMLTNASALESVSPGMEGVTEVPEERNQQCLSVAKVVRIITDAIGESTGLLVEKETTEEPTQVSVTQLIKKMEKVEEHNRFSEKDSGRQRSKEDGGKLEVSSVTVGASSAEKVKRMAVSERKTEQRKEETSLAVDARFRNDVLIGTDSPSAKTFEGASNGAVRKECFPELKDASSVWARRNEPNFLVGNITRAYSVLSGICSRNTNIADELVTTNQEVIWQQIVLSNKMVSKQFRKCKPLFNIPVPTLKTKNKSEKKNKKETNKLRFEDESESEGDEYGKVDEAVVDEEDENDGEGSLFHLKPEDFEDLEHELDKMDDEDENEEPTAKEEEPSSRKYRKTIVDDRFFSLAEMEEFLDKEEKRDSSKGFFDEFVDENVDATDGADYHYADFFGTDVDKPESEVFGEAELEKEKKKKKKKEKVNGFGELEEKMSAEKLKKKKKKKSMSTDVMEEEAHAEVKLEKTKKKNIITGKSEEGDLAEVRREKKKKKIVNDEMEVFTEIRPKKQKRQANTPSDEIEEEVPVEIEPGRKKKEKRVITDEQEGVPIEGRPKKKRKGSVTTDVPEEEVPTEERLKKKKLIIDEPAEGVPVETGKKKQDSDLFEEERQWPARSEPLKKQKEMDEGKQKKQPKKKVRFVEECDDPEELSDEAEKFVNEEDAAGDDRVLLGAISFDEENAETEFQKRQKKIRAKIEAIEEANLAPRSWELSGEVTAVDRDENTMLEQHVAFEQTRKSAPIITVDRTAKLEAMIVQRIKDNVFDDVEKKVREPETSNKYRSAVEEGMVKKSLADVYEEQYMKAQQRPSQATDEGNVNEKAEEIEKLMKNLFTKLDALSHYSYVPPEIRPEVRVISNMASLQKEEVGPMTSTDDLLVAPEEMRRHEKGEVKGTEERSDTDKARERRKKKKFQAAKKKRSAAGNEENVEGELKTKKKKKRTDRSKENGSSKTRSSTFFRQLQQAASEEVKQKSKKTKKEKADKVNASAKYIL